jgi:hypothetical protein
MRLSPVRIQWQLPPPRVLFTPIHAEILYQDLRLPDE